MVIAQDAQGAEVARPWVEQAGGTFRALIDQENRVGKAYGLKYVPVGILLDEAGNLVKAVSTVNIDNENFRSELERWVGGGQIPAEWSGIGPPALKHLTAKEEEADARFQLGVILLKQEKKEEAIDQLRAAMVLDPENWLIRKQLWAIESPDAFYAGDVDYAWQKEQVSREAELIGKK